MKTEDLVFWVGIVFSIVVVSIVLLGLFLKWWGGKLSTLTVLSNVFWLFYHIFVQKKQREETRKKREKESIEKMIVWGIEPLLNEIQENKEKMIELHKKHQAHLLKAKMPKVYCPNHDSEVKKHASFKDLKKGHRKLEERLEKYMKARNKYNITLSKLGETRFSFDKISDEIEALRSRLDLAEDLKKIKRDYMEQYNIRSSDLADMKVKKEKLEDKDKRTTNTLRSLPKIGLRDPDKKSISWDEALKAKDITKIMEGKEDEGE